MKIDKLKLVTLTALLSLATCLPAFAQTQPIHAFEIGTESYYYKYEEPGLMEMEGMLSGVVGEYTYRGPLVKKITGATFFTLEGRFMSGEADYDGHYLNGTPVTFDDEEQWMYEIRGIVGDDFTVMEDWTLTPYFGFGYRYLNDADDSHVSGDYERESNYYYSPLGCTLSKTFHNDWQFAGTVEFDFFWYGKQASHMSAVSYIDFENSQDRGYGLRGSIEIKKEFEYVALAVEPFVRFWDIADSDHTSAGWYEPQNKTIEAGAKFALSF